MQLGKVIRSPILHTLILQGGAQGLLLLFSMLMARQVSLETFGNFVFGFQFGLVCAGVVSLGAAFYLAKHFAEYESSIEGALSTFKLQNQFLARGVLILLTIWCVFAFSYRDWAATGSFGISISNFLIVMMMAFYTAIGKAPFGNLLQAGRSLVLCIGMFLSVLIGAAVSPITVVLVVASVYSLSIYFVVGGKYSMRFSNVPAKGQFEFARQHIYSVIMAGIDVLVLKLVVAADEVAIYGVALFLSNIASFALYAINANYTAPISRSLRSNSLADTQKLLRKIAGVCVLLSLPFAVLLIIFAMNLTLFYGEQFEPSERIFLILLAGQIVNVFVGSVALVANVSGYGATISRFIFQSLLLKIIVGAAAANWFGAFGMAIVASAANAIWNIRSFLLVRKSMGLNTTILRLSDCG